MQNLGLDEAKTGMKIARRNINNLRYADDTTLMAENKEEWKSLLMKVKEQSDKAGLNLNIQKAKIMASGPITSWQIIWRTLEMWQTLFSWAPKSLHKVTVAIKLKDACTLKKKKKKKSYDKPNQSIKKQRHYFANKSWYSKNYGFSSNHVWMWDLDHK